MARDKAPPQDISEIISVAALTDELTLWANIPRPAARRIAQESEKVIKAIKEGEVVVLEYDDKGTAWVVDRSSPHKPSLKWQKCGVSFLLTTGSHDVHKCRVTRIYGSYSTEELPTAECFRASADTTWSMLVSRGFSDAELFDIVIPKRTFDRRQSKKEPLTIEETDKALRLVRIADLASKVFGDNDKAQRWLRKPKRSLDGETPVAYLNSEFGARIVEEMLMRIDSGILA